MVGAANEATAERVSRDRRRKVFTIGFSRPYYSYDAGWTLDLTGRMDQSVMELGLERWPPIASSQLAEHLPSPSIVVRESLLDSGRVCWLGGRTRQRLA